MEPDVTTKILAAAKEVFTQKGYAAARTQEIAEAAGVNKGLLHYYKWNKEKLFRAVFDEAFHDLMVSINSVFEADIPLFEKIEKFVDTYMDVLIANPALPSFVINELNQNQEVFVKDILNRKERPNPMKLLVQIQLEAQAGRIREDVTPFNFFLNMLSICAFPFVARPLLQQLIQIDDQTYMQLMQKRKKEVTDFIIHAIQKNWFFLELIYLIG